MKARYGTINVSAALRDSITPPQSGCGSCRQMPRDGISSFEGRPLKPIRTGVRAFRRGRGKSHPDCAAHTAMAALVQSRNHRPAAGRAGPTDPMVEAQTTVHVGRALKLQPQ